MKINHIGYAVNDIVLSISMFEKLGFHILDEAVKDDKRNVEIALMKNNEIVVELISPLNEHSPITDILKKNGNVPYHLCFETDDIDKKICELKECGFITIDKKDKAIALNNKDVVFLYNKSVGIVELIEF